MFGIRLCKLNLKKMGGGGDLRVSYTSKESTPVFLVGCFIFFYSIKTYQTLWMSFPIVQSSCDSVPILTAIPCNRNLQSILSLCDIFCPVDWALNLICDSKRLNNLKKNLTRSFRFLSLCIRARRLYPQN